LLKYKNNNEINHTFSLITERRKLYIGASAENSPVSTSRMFDGAISAPTPGIVFIHAKVLTFR